MSNVMEENFEGNSANENLLTQSYCESIQRVTGKDRASLLDFEIPAHVLEKRKEAWNALFEKYSSNIQKCMQAEMESPKQEKEEEWTTKNNQRFPMRKSMTMVQYWVNTGNQPYAPNHLEKSQSESGSSLAEEYVETVGSINSPCQIKNVSLEKNHETNETSGHMRLRLASSSGSSVDTAAYILANNNTTKKADAIAIVEGSKIVNKDPSHPLVATNGIEKVNRSKKEALSFENILHNLRSKQLDISISKNINKNVGTVNDVSKNLQNKNENEEDWSPNSDESIFKSKYDFQFLTQNSVEQNNGIEKSLHTSSILENKTFKRKKLYNSTESPAEFTPVSEDNASQLTLRIPVKKCEHPALDTPRISSRPSYLVRHHRLKSRSRRKQRISRSFKMLHQKIDESNSNLNVTDEDNSQNLNIENNLKNFLQGNSQPINEIEEDCDQNLKKALDCSDDVKIQELFKRKSSIVNKNFSSDSKKEAFNLRPMVISLQRLPYKYDSVEISSLPEKCHSLNINKNEEKINCEKSSKNLPSKKSHILKEVKSDNFKTVIHGVSPNLSRNNESDNIDCKSSLTNSHRFSNKILDNYSRKSMNFIIALSSSDDETELTTTDLIKSTKKILKKKSQLIKKSIGVNDCLEKEPLGSNLKVDCKCNKSEISNSNQIKNKIKTGDGQRNSDKVSKLVHSEKNKLTHVSRKNFLENNNKTKTNLSISKKTDKKFSLMSSDEESIIVEPKDRSVPNKFLKKNKENISFDDKALKQKFDQTSNDVSPSIENQKTSLKEKNFVALETKSLSLKKHRIMKNFKSSGNTSSSSDEDFHLSVKPNFFCKPKLIPSAVKDIVSKSSSEETVTNLIGDSSVHSVLLRKNEKKISDLEERINKIKMNNQSTLLNSDNNYSKPQRQTFLQIMDSSKEENFIENKSLVKEIDVKKTLQNKNKKPYKEQSVTLHDKPRNKKDREKSKKEYLSSKKPKRKSEIFLSSDEECVIPLKIKST